LDWIPKGGSLLQGTITTQRHFNYNYLTLPTFNPSSLGYMNSANNTASSVLANSFICVIQRGILLQNVTTVK
jgi:hypothetical protein